MGGVFDVAECPAVRVLDDEIGVFYPLFLAHKPIHSMTRAKKRATVIRKRRTDAASSDMTVVSIALWTRANKRFFIPHPAMRRRVSRIAQRRMTAY
jgi:hypothetical protein